MATTSTSHSSGSMSMVQQGLQQKNRNILKATDNQSAATEAA